MYLWSLSAPPGSAHSCGAVLLYRPRFTLCSSFSDADSRFIHAEFPYNNISFHVVCLYAPNRNLGRDTFLQFVSECVDLGSPPSSAGTKDRHGLVPASMPGVLISLHRIAVW